MTRDPVREALVSARHIESGEGLDDDIKPTEWIVTDAHGRPEVTCKSAREAANRFIQFNGIRPSQKRKIIERVVTERDVTKELIQ